MQTAKGLSPLYTPNSKILILGTLPSQTSRETQKYYANNSNRFWKIICEFFGVAVPDTYDQRIQMLNSHNIAVWDLIDTCEIEGSKDSTITNPEFNDLQDLLDKTKIEVVLLNGKIAYEMYEQRFKGLNVLYKLVPSTSPINAKFDKQQWFEALDLSTYTYENAVRHYVKLMGNNPLYKVVKTDNETTYTFDESYGIARTCVECGVNSSMLKQALIKAIEKGQI